MKGYTEIKVIATETKEINISAYTPKKIKGGRWAKTVAKKDMAVRENYPNAEIFMLYATKRLSKKERWADNLLGFFTCLPFGIPELIHSFKNIDNEFYLVTTGESCRLVAVTKESLTEFMLATAPAGKKFCGCGYKFQNLGKIKE